MTETFKEQLRDYLSGKLNIEEEENYPIFPYVSIYQNNLYTYIADKTVSPQTTAYHLIKGKDGNGNDLDEQILYGIDRDDNSGFIVILDKLFNPIQFINSYSSGTRFGIFELLIIDDDGRFYGVENKSGTRRFIMLNNILVKAKNQANYKVTLRQSYNLPEILQTGTINQMIKKPLGNKYLFCTTVINSSTLVQQPTLVELTINVGMPNDWVTHMYSNTSCTLNSVLASWDQNDNISFKIVAIYRTPSLTSGNVYVLSGNNDTITLDSELVLPNPRADFIESVILNSNTMYLSYCYTNESGVYNQYIYKIGNSLEQIFISPNTDVAMPGSLIKSELYSDGYNAYISFNVPNADDTIDYYMGIIYNDNLYYNNFGDLTYTTSQNLYATNTFHQFNLYSYYLQLGDKSYKALSIFNNLNYNSLPYSNINGLVPNNVVLSDDVGVPLFARNLYNKVINDNITVSTVEIPSTILNYDLGPIYEIEQQILLSETNQEITHTTQSINKNVYEAVDINFYNTLTMESNSIDNLPGAIRINKSVSKDKDYYSAQASKVKINFTDNTSYVMALDPAGQVGIIDDKARYTFTIYVPSNKNVNNIEIISNDEITSYVTINGTFASGKYYQITQDVYVE